MQQKSVFAAEGGEERPRKVFVISLHRTMTRSTDALLSMAGMETVHWPKSFRGVDLQNAIKGQERDPERVYSILSPLLGHYDAFGDVPFPALFPQLARDFPDARFVLVHRDPWGWVRSVREHIQGRELKAFEKVQYWAYLHKPVKNIRALTDEQLLGVYFSHLFAVYEFFESRGELDRVCFVSIENPEAGEKISRFLGVALRPFPRIIGGKTDWETVQAWLRSAPGKADPQRVLTQVLAQDGRLEESVEAARKLVRRDPANPNPYRILVRLLEKAGRRSEAMAVSEQAVEAGTRSPRLHILAAFHALKRAQMYRFLGLLSKTTRLKWGRFYEKMGGSLPF